MRWSSLPLIACQAFILLGDVARSLGDDRRGRALCEASLARDDGFFGPPARRSLGIVALHDGNVGKAKSLITESLRRRLGVGDKLGILECVAALAAVAVARDESVRAARLLGAVKATLRDIGGALYFGDRLEHAKTLSSLRSARADDHVAAAFDHGRAMTLEQAVACPLAD
jgi:hypothetical protein